MTPEEIADQFEKLHGERPSLRVLHVLSACSEDMNRNLLAPIPVSFDGKSKPMEQVFPRTTEAMLRVGMSEKIEDK